jgi:hypothetical protein
MAKSFYTANKADGHAYSDIHVNLTEKRKSKTGSA